MKLRAAIFCIGGLSAVVACARSAPELPPAAQRKEDNRMEGLKDNYQKAEAVFVGQVIAMDQSPASWSGTLAVYQSVSYRVLRTLKGHVGAQGDQVAVRHLLAQGSPTADEQEPRLRASLFAPGQRLLVFARKQDGVLTCLNPSDGVVLAMDKILQALAAH